MFHQIYATSTIKPLDISVCMDPSHETHMYVYILWTGMCLMHAKGGLTIFIDRLQTKCTDWVLFNHATGGAISVILQIVWSRFLCFVMRASVFCGHCLSFFPAPEKFLNTIFLLPLYKLAKTPSSLWQASLLWCSSHDSALMMVVSTQHFQSCLYILITVNLTTSSQLTPTLLGMPTLYHL